MSYWSDGDTYLDIHEVTKKPVHRLLSEKEKSVQNETIFNVKDDLLLYSSSGNGYYELSFDGIVIGRYFKISFLFNRRGGSGNIRAGLLEVVDQECINS